MPRSRTGNKYIDVVPPTRFSIQLYFVILWNRLDNYLILEKTNHLNIANYWSVKLESLKYFIRH